MIILLISVLLFGTYFRKELIDFFAPLLQERDESQFSGSSETMRIRLRKALPIWYLLLLLPFLQYDFRMFLIIVCLFLYLLKKDYFKKRKQHQKEINALQFQFPIWLRQIQILLQTNTVYGALSSSYEQAPNLIKPDLEILMQELHHDAIHLDPYLHFLSRYHLAEVERAMKLLYRYQSVGKQDCTIQLNRLIQTTTKWLRTQRQKRNDETHSIYQWWGMLPLLGVTIVFMSVMFELILSLFGKGVM